jgi:hypothetical protein
VGRPDFSLGRRAKITVEMASDGGAAWRSATLAELVYTAVHPAFLAPAAPLGFVRRPTDGRLD